VEDIEIMELLESKGDLNEGFPDGLFLEMRLLFLVLHDLLIEVAVVGEFHDNAG
jgi:hypothetical protein